MKRLLVIIPLLFIALACMPAVSPTPSPAPASSPPVIVAFTATPSGITPAQNSTLSWNVTGSTSVIIDNGIGNVAAAGTRVVSPNITTNYTLIATNASGAVSQSAAVIVGGMLPPAVTLPPLPSGLPSGVRPNIVVFDISPNLIRKHLGERATMRWEVLGAINVRIEPGFGDVSHAGTRVLTPPDDTFYTLTAHNANGQVTATQQLIVRP